jgi:hypothetical protein
VLYLHTLPERWWVELLVGRGMDALQLHTLLLLLVLLLLLLQVTLGSSDVQAIDFTAFRTSARSSLTAVLAPELSATFRASVKAELLPASAAGTAISGSNPAGAAGVDGSGFLELRGVKQGSYVLRLSCVAVGVAGPGCEPWEMPVQVRVWGGGEGCPKGRGLMRAGKGAFVPCGLCQHGSYVLS